MQNQIQGPQDIVAFVKAGAATFTILSKNKGIRHTFKVVKTDNNPKAYFVSVMTGQSNESDYTYIGMLYNNDRVGLQFVPGKKSTIDNNDPRVLGFAWFIFNMHKAELSSYIHFFHMGRCCHCNRPLTTPESVLTGWGPICRKRNEGAIRACLAA